MNRKFIVSIMMLFIIMICCNGCVTTPVCITSSNTPVNGKSVQENLGETRGSDSAISILGLWMVGRPDTGAAIDEAINGKKADALINIQCYQETAYYILFSLTTVVVEGEAVKFASKEEGNGKKRTR
jgi:hypothetical protein